MGPKMCVSPSFVWVERGPKYEQVPVPCKVCWQCRQNRINDYTARCMAEGSCSVESCVITLTYATLDDISHRVLHPAHFQNFMKRLRKRGHVVRYLVAGEYGSLKDRAHFHAILFFQKLQPLDGAKPSFYVRWDKARQIHLTPQSEWGLFSREVPHEKDWHIREWPHGHVQVSWGLTEKSVRYVTKYCLKSTEEDNSDWWFSFSKVPALGGPWFEKKADLAIQLGAMPTSFHYTPPGGRHDRKYLMTGATKRDYIKRVQAGIQPDDSTLNEWVLQALEKYRRLDRLADANQPFTADDWQQFAAGLRRRRISKKSLLRLYEEMYVYELVYESVPPSLGYLPRCIGKKLRDDFDEDEYRSFLVRIEEAYADEQDDEEE